MKTNRVNTVKPYQTYTVTVRLIRSYVIMHPITKVVVLHYNEEGTREVSVRTRRRLMFYGTLDVPVFIEGPFAQQSTKRLIRKAVIDRAIEY